MERGYGLLRPCLITGSQQRTMPFATGCKPGGPGLNKNKTAPRGAVLSDRIRAALERIGHLAVNELPARVVLALHVAVQVAVTVADGEWRLFIQRVVQTDHQHRV